MPVMLVATGWTGWTGWTCGRSHVSPVQDVTALPLLARGEPKLCLAVHSLQHIVDVKLCEAEFHCRSQRSPWPTCLPQQQCCSLHWEAHRRNMQMNRLKCLKHIERETAGLMMNGVHVFTLIISPISPKTALLHECLACCMLRRFVARSLAPHACAMTSQALTHQPQ